MSNKSSEYRETGFLCDTVIYAGDKQFNAHSLYLAEKSTFFESILASSSKGDDGFYQIVLKDFHPELLSIVLDYMYTGKFVIDASLFGNPELISDIVENTFQQFGVNYQGQQEESPAQPQVKRIKQENVTPPVSSSTSRYSNGRRIQVKREGTVKKEETDKKSSISSHGDSVMCEYCGATVADYDSHVASVHQNNGYLVKTEATDDDDVNNNNNNMINDQQVTTSSQIRRGSKYSDGPKPFLCELCDKTYSSTSSLKLHMRNSHFKPAYECMICNKGFPYPSQLNSHMRIHTGERPYKCPYCPKDFAAQLNLKQHMRVHTQEKPYVCDVCNRAFSQRSHLQTHTRTHTGEKPYACSHCDKSYKNRLDLRLHSYKIHGVQLHVRSAHNDKNTGSKLQRALKQESGSSDDATAGNPNQQELC